MYSCRYTRIRTCLCRPAQRHSHTYIHASAFTGHAEVSQGIHTPTEKHQSIQHTGRLHRNTTTPQRAKTHMCTPPHRQGEDRPKMGGPSTVTTHPTHMYMFVLTPEAQHTLTLLMGGSPCRATNTAAYCSTSSSNASALPLTLRVYTMASTLCVCACVCLEGPLFLSLQ